MNQNEINALIGAWESQLMALEIYIKMNSPTFIKRYYYGQCRAYQDIIKWAMM